MTLFEQDQQLVYVSDWLTMRADTVTQQTYSTTAMERIMVTVTCSLGDYLASRSTWRKRPKWSICGEPIAMSALVLSRVNVHQV